MNSPGYWSISQGFLGAPAAISGGGSAAASSGNGATPGQFNGFTFSPPPLVLNGQNVAGGLNFTGLFPASQIDQASQAYAFTIANTNNAYGFVGAAINAAQNSAAAIFGQIIPAETQFGNVEGQAMLQEAAAMQTAASNLGNSGGGLFGFL